MRYTTFTNPYRPGAGHMPPHLAGRDDALAEFERLLGQDVILENMVLTGLRGVGKTVLLDTFKPRAIEEGWLWVGADLSEAASLTEGESCQPPHDGHVGRNVDLHHARPVSNRLRCRF